MKKETIEINLTDEDHEQIMQICKEEGKSLFEKLDEIVHTFLSEGETHPTAVAI